MFHSEDGLYFAREGNTVTITKTNDGWKPKEDSSNVSFTQTLPEGTWCSAVCSVSNAGEENGRWYKAMDFHNESRESVTDKG